MWAASSSALASELVSSIEYPAARSRVSAAAAISAKSGFEMSPTAKPIVIVSCRRRLWASRSGSYASSATAASTRSCMARLTSG